MTPVIRAVASGAAGVFVQDMLGPHIDRILKPDSDFAKKAARAATAGIATGAVYYALGMFGKG